jgi:ubiquinol-cytochrome c reductase iron-sulfur subunit
VTNEIEPAADAQYDHGPGVDVYDHDEPIANPGLLPHEPRPTDVDPDLEKRAERQVATLFGLSAVFAVLFCVFYFVLEIGDNPDVIFGMGASNVVLGLCLGLSLLCIGVGAIHWSRKLMNDHEIVEYRHPASSSEEDREEAVGALMQGIEDSGIGRRPLVRNSLIGAMAFLGLPAIVALRDLGPLPGRKLYNTVWQRNMPLVIDVSGTKIKSSDLEIGDLVNAEPYVFFHDWEHEGEDGQMEVVEQYEGTELLQAKAKAAIIMVKMHPDDITAWDGRENWSVNGILAYSKICTHVGCPISLYEQQTHHLLCPCHQSTFDLADNGKVVFGPAARHLPQLPIMEDENGYLVARSDFTEPVGPSFWERG